MLWFLRVNEVNTPVTDLLDATAVRKITDLMRHTFLVSTMYY